MKEKKKKKRKNEEEGSIGEIYISIQNNSTYSLICSWFIITNRDGLAMFHNQNQKWKKRKQKKKKKNKKRKKKKRRRKKKKKKKKGRRRLVDSSRWESIRVEAGMRKKEICGKNISI